mmetsp:Transcript_16351/g.24212  ORF Transcript_16351/g.24212 Transcript_16351/m.24212 type:complete len:126 (+) Transcript_16351:1520-1897(+)
MSSCTAKLVRTDPPLQTPLPRRMYPFSSTPRVAAPPSKLSHFEVSCRNQATTDKLRAREGERARATSANKWCWIRMRHRVLPPSTATALEEQQQVEALRFQSSRMKPPKQRLTATVDPRLSDPSW